MIFISKKILKQVNKTTLSYGLIGSGDNVLLALSGGKDSLTLAHSLKSMQRVVPFEFNFKALTVSYGIDEDFTQLKEHCKIHKIEHVVEDTNIFEISQDKIRKNSSFCSFFSRMRRGALYTYAKNNGFNKLALGHHFDDVVESFFMNLFYNGAMRSMPPKYRAYNGLYVIRPLIEIRERQIIDCSINNSLPTVGDEYCPSLKFDVKMPYARFDMKTFVSDLEKKYPNLTTSIKSSFKNIHINSFMLNMN